MTGILEMMKATQDAHAAEIAGLKAAIAALQAGAAHVPAAAPVAADPFAGFGGATAAPPPPPPPPPPPANVTAEQITALITPHVENPAIKEALGAEMRAMGINALPETRADQYAELYTRFQSAIARFSGAGAASGASII